MIIKYVYFRSEDKLNKPTGRDLGVVLVAFVACDSL